MTESKRITVLLTGANGQLGKCIQSLINKDSFSQINLAPLTSADLDITSKQQIEDAISQIRPDVVINAAAYTAVDKAESEPEKAFSVNAAGVQYLAEICKQHHVKLIHISTDYVFDGTSTEPYLPNEAVRPVSVYGRSKLAGELAIQSILPTAVIIRTAWVFSEYQGNFLTTMLRLFDERDALGIVADQVGCPTYAGDLANVCLQIAIKQCSQSVPPFGIYHYSGNEQCSWYEFARFIYLVAEGHGVTIVNKHVKFSELTTDEYPTPAHRPAYSVMSNETIEDTFNVEASNWRQAVDNIIYKFKGSDKKYLE